MNPKVRPLVHFAWGLAFGSVAALGLLGSHVWPAYILGAYFLDYAVARTRGVRLASLTLGWGVGCMVAYYLGGNTWGFHFVAIFGGLHVIMAVVTRAAWGRFLATRSWTGPRAFTATAAFYFLLYLGWDVVGWQMPVDGAVLLDVSAWVGGARLIGGSGVCAIVIASSTLAARATNWDQRLGWPAAGAVLLLGLTALARFSAPAGDDRTIMVGFIQPNVDEVYYRGRVINRGLREVFQERLSRLTAALPAVDVIATTESFDGALHLAIPQLLWPWQDLARQRKAAVLLASYKPEPNGRKSNVVIGIESTGDVVGVYRKNYLVPLAEDTLESGSSRQLLTFASGAVIGPVICLEALAGDAVEEQTAKGANVIFGTTSDVTLRSSALPFMHIAGSRFRALENGRSIIWASNAGPSGWFDRWGGFHQHTGFRVAAAAVAAVPLHGDPSPFPRLRPWLALLCALWLSTAALSGRRTRPVVPLPDLDVSRPARWLAIPAATLGWAVITFGYAGYVELVHGQPQRWRLAIEQQFVDFPVPFGDPRAPWGEYRPSRPDGLDGALSFMFAQYGWYISPQELRVALGELPVDATLDDVRQRVCERLGIALEPVAGSEPPMLATILKLGDGGFVIASNTDEDTAPTVFLPRQGLATTADPSVTSALKGAALLPVGACAER